MAERLAAPRHAYSHRDAGDRTAYTDPHAYAAALKRAPGMASLNFPRPGRPLLPAGAVLYTVLVAGRGSNLTIGLYPCLSHIRSKGTAYGKICYTLSNPDLHHRRRSGTREWRGLGIGGAMNPTPSSTLTRWAAHLRARGWATGVAALLEAAAPLQPLGEALFVGGKFFLSPWASPEALQALDALVTDEETRAAFLQALHRPPGAAAP